MPIADLTIITPSIPGREHLLSECIQSVQNQTLRPWAHLIRVQSPLSERLDVAHIAAQQQALLPAVETGWLSCLGDDDLYLPNHVDTVAEHFDRADVVYTLDEQRHLPSTDVNGWSNDEILELLGRMNFLNGSSAMRTELVREVGGWGVPDANGVFESGATWEDWDLNIRMARAGARFLFVPVTTWVYRLGPHARSSTSR
jgi:GT2 family glycosyltransferase